MNSEEHIAQNVFLYDRKRIELSGITDVTAFTDTAVEAQYSGGGIAIEGTGLKIEEFSSQSGKLTVIGNISSFYYFGRSKESKGGFLHRFIS